MATNFGEIPYGLTDLQLFALDGNDAPIGTGVAVPIGRKLEFTPKEDTQDLTGYNGVVATNTHNTSADVTLEHGGVSLDVAVKIGGGTITTSGTSPNQTKTLPVGKAGVARPYVMVIGKSLGDDGGDCWVKLYKVKFEILKGNVNEGEYYITSATGKAVRNKDGNLFDIIQHETPTAIASS